MGDHSLHDQLDHRSMTRGTSCRQDTSSSSANTLDYPAHYIRYILPDVNRTRTSHDLFFFFFLKQVNKMITYQI